MDDHVCLLNKYNISPQDNVATINRKVWEVFEFDLVFECICSYMYLGLYVH